MIKRLAPALLILAAAMGTSTVALGDPSLPDVPAHRHFFENEAGRLVQVGPRVCDDPSLQRSFNQFHFNVHLNPNGPDIMRKDCSFVAP